MNKFIGVLLVLGTALYVLNPFDIPGPVDDFGVSIVGIIGAICQFAKKPKNKDVIAVVNQ